MIFLSFLGALFVSWGAVWAQPTDHREWSGVVVLGPEKWLCDGRGRLQLKVEAVDVGEFAVPGEDRPTVAYNQRIGDCDEVRMAILGQLGASDTIVRIDLYFRSKMYFQEVIEVRYGSGSSGGFRDPVCLHRLSRLFVVTLPDVQVDGRPLVLTDSKDETVDFKRSKCAAL